ncbi:unnamed protein product [Prunus brigantina]
MLFHLHRRTSIGEGEDDVPTPMDEEISNNMKNCKKCQPRVIPGCKSFSVLTAIVELMHGKIKYRMSNLCFDYFWGFSRECFRRTIVCRKTINTREKVLNGLGLGYEKITPAKIMHVIHKEYETLDTALYAMSRGSKDISKERQDPTKSHAYRLET